jgi:hypothetical protein
VPFPKPAVLGHEVAGEVVAHGPGSPSAQLDALPVGSKAVAAFIMPCLDCGFCSTGQEEMCDKFFAFNRGRGVLYDGTTRLYTADAGSTLTLTQECEPIDLSISSWSKFSMYVDNEKVRLYQREVCTRRTQARPWRVLTLLRRVLTLLRRLLTLLRLARGDVLHGRAGAVLRHPGVGGGGAAAPRAVRGERHAGLRALHGVRCMLTLLRRVLTLLRRVLTLLRRVLTVLRRSAQRRGTQTGRDAGHRGHWWHR